MKPKISPCPDCRSTGPGIIEGTPAAPPSLSSFERREGHKALRYDKATRTIKTFDPNPPGRNRRFRVGCPCGAFGPWTRTVVRAIEVWNEKEKP